MEELSYEQIRTEALQAGIKDNRVTIGTWAKFMGYTKRKRQKKGHISIVYTAPKTVNP